MALSLLAEYDEIVRFSNILHDGASEPEFLRFALSVDDLRVKFVSTQRECERLMVELQKANAIQSGLERKLDTARHMLDMEKKKRKAAETKMEELENQLTLVRDLVWDGRNKLHDETRERLASVYSHASSCTSFGPRGNGLKESFVNRMRESEGLSRISEVRDSSGSLISELGYTRSEDELEVSRIHSPGFRKHRRSQQLDAPTGAKKPRSSFTTLQSGPSRESNKVLTDAKECLVATTTVTMTREGPVTAKSIIETLPSQEKLTYHPRTPGRPPLQPNLNSVPTAPPVSSSESEESMICTKDEGGKSLYPSPSPCYSGLNIMARDKLNTRPHFFCQKTIVKADTCEPCGKRIKFGKLAAKCRDCRATVHTECKEKLPLPCVPSTCTPISKGQLGVISDYTPTVPPMIPSLIVHCVNEIEARGLKEVGIYRVSGSERDVKTLKEKFLKCRGAPNLSNIDIHVVCGAVKDFLRSLREPLVTPSLLSDFIRCIEPSEEADQQARLYQVVSDLPRPNRDTLAFLILHLQRVSECPECKMPIDNLAKVFGPTVVGYSSANPDPHLMMCETMKQVAVMQLMMRTPSSYWACHVNSSFGTPCENRTPDIGGLTSRNPSSSSIQRTGFFNTPIGTFKWNSLEKKYSKIFLSSVKYSLRKNCEERCPKKVHQRYVHLSPYDTLFQRRHSFCSFTSYKCDKCAVCEEKIQFGRIGVKCHMCQSKVHCTCMKKLPLPCVPAMTENYGKQQFGDLSDFCPVVPPLIPALIIHCFQEIEKRGLEERFIYQIPASQHDVTILKEKFLSGCIPKLSDVNIHVVCGVVKDFLLSLREPLIMQNMWLEFVKCLELSDQYERETFLFHSVQKLKQPNKDTLCFIILHFQRIAGSRKCAMPENSLARLFGPTIVGFSSPNPTTNAVMEESVITVNVMHHLLKTPASYWNHIINLSIEAGLKYQVKYKNIRFIQDNVQKCE